MKRHRKGPHAEQTLDNTLEEVSRPPCRLRGGQGTRFYAAWTQRCTNVCKAGRKWTPKQARAGMMGKSLHSRAENEEGGKRGPQPPGFSDGSDPSPNPEAYS